MGSDQAADLQSTPAPGPEPLPDWVAVAQVTAPHGLRGHVKVTLLTDWPERLREGTLVRLFPPVEGQPEECRFQLLRWDGDHGVGRITGINRREDAEKLRGRDLQVARNHCPPLPPGQFYLFELVGMSVWDRNGAYLGQLVEVLTGGANDVYRVVNPATREEVLVPALRQVVEQVDVSARRMQVNLPPGLAITDPQPLASQGPSPATPVPDRGEQAVGENRQAHEGGPGADGSVHG